MSDVKQPGELFLEYRIVGVIDAGGMGVVYKAVEPYSGDMVAIKCRLPSHDDRDDYRRRFEQESKFYPKLRHPNIVRMRRAGVAPGDVPFIVMDLLEGNTLRKLLIKFAALSRPMELLPALHIMVQVAHAMAFAHKKGILHRDLKPENIMVGSNGDERGHAWVLDFGIAKMEHGGMSTEELPAVGTVAYLSPEQAKALSRPAKSGKRPTFDGRADIYSFGVVLYELITGNHIFMDPTNHGSDEQIVGGHLTAEPKPLHKVRKDCPLGVSKIASKCLEKDPAARYQSFDEVRSELQAQMHEMARALPPNPMVAQKVAEEEAQAARLAAFREMPVGDTDEGATVVRDASKVEAPGSHPVPGVTAELPAFVSSGSPLPFGPAPPSAPPVPVPVPALRGKGHTVKISRAALPQASLPITSAPPSKLPATAMLPKATAMPPSTPAMASPTMTSQASTTSANASPTRTGQPVNTTPLAIIRGPSQASPPTLFLAAGMGFAVLLAAAALVITLRARPPNSPTDGAPSIPDTASVPAVPSIWTASASTPLPAKADSTASATPTASSASTASFTEAASSSAVTPPPTSDVKTSSPSTSETAKAPPPPKTPKRPPPAGVKAPAARTRIFPLFDAPPDPQPKGRR